jgi:hypothetical protein
MTGGAGVAGWVPDLMDRSRLGTGVEFVSRPEDLVAVDAEVVVVDLGRLGDPARVAGVRGRLIGFAPHVDDGTLAAARAAGFDEALARSVFFRRWPQLRGGS